jgi:dienelactone hydrolase
VLVKTSLFVALVLWQLLWSAPVFAQPAAADPVARDMNEEVFRVPVKVRDMFNREETGQVAITVFRPKGDGPFPLMVFNHGRATADKRASQGRSRPENLARYFLAKGFVVLAPTRIGYAETYGSFDPEDSGRCEIARYEPMAIAASDQVLATVEFAKTLNFVDTSRWIVAGVSVGGLTSIATVGRNPTGLLGGINFAGGAGGNPDSRPGKPCNPSALANLWGVQAKDARVPMLWLYWKNDKFWGEQQPRDWHTSWTRQGGKAEFVSLEPAGEDGHAGMNIAMEAWLGPVDKFLAGLGFTGKAIIEKPVPTNFAALVEVAKLPVTGPRQVAGYESFLKLALPRAIALGDKGAWATARGDYAHGKALGSCHRTGQVCRLYAVDDEVVW